MRKTHYRPLQAGLLALAVSVGTAAGAQTTFANSNNPSAAVRLERVNASGTVLQIRQQRNSVSYFPLSQNTVLRDPRTGVSYPLRMLDSEVVAAKRATAAAGELEVVTLKFAPFLDKVEQFELIDPSKPAQALYIKGIRQATPAEVASAEGI